MITFLCKVTTSAQAVTYVQVKALSQTKKTMILDLGSFDGLQYGDIGKFYFDKGVLNNNKDDRFVGLGQAIKVNGSNSIWFFKESLKHPSLKAKSSLIYFSYRDYLSHLQTIKKERIKFVHSSQKEYNFDKVKNFKVKNKIKLTSDEQNIIQNIYDMGEWKKEDLYFIDSSGNKIDTKWIKNLLTINEKDNYVIQFNKKRVDDFISNFMQFSKDNNDQQIDSGLASNSVMNKYKLRKIKRQKIREETIKLIEKEGPDWSKGLSEKELKQFIKNKGLINEKERQQKALFVQGPNEVFLLYEFDLVNHTADNGLGDQEPKDVRPYALTIGYELYWVLFMDYLSNISTTFSFRKSRNLYNLGRLNAFSSENILSLAISYYPFKNPGLSNVFLTYVSAGWRRGWANVTSIIDRNLTNHYDVYSFPFIQLGLKYRFVNWFTVQTTLTFEKYKFIINNPQTSDNFPRGFNVDDAHLGLGISYLF